MCYWQAVLHYIIVHKKLSQNTALVAYLGNVAEQAEKVEDPIAVHAVHVEAVYHKHTALLVHASLTTTIVVTSHWLLAKTLHQSKRSYLISRYTATLAMPVIKVHKTAISFIPPQLQAHTHINS